MADSIINDVLAMGKTVAVEISKNKMEAYLSLTPMADGQPITRQEVDAVLQQQNVIYGIRDDVIEMALEWQRTSQPMTVAKGTDPVHGLDAKIEYKYKEGALTARPTELSDGRVDFYNLNLIPNVDEGEVLAIKRSATAGTPGYTITGEEISAKPGKDVQIKIGKNVQLMTGIEANIPDAETVAIATASGYVSHAANKISVATVYEIGGDVDLTTGNIEFNGTVVVKGSVREGFRVTANSDVVVMGTVSDGVVECPGNVKVQNGIIGRSKTRIKAGQSVFCRFVENSIIEAGEDVVVGESIMHSRVNARGSVIVGGKGSIIGGVTRAGEEINCKTAGSPLATTTELEAGINPELRSELAQLLKEKEAKETDYDKAVKAIALLKRMQSEQEMHPDKKALLVQVVKVQVQLANQLESINESIRIIEEQIKQSERGKIAAQVALHPGVKVTIGTATVHIHDPHQFVSLTVYEDQIRISPYK